MNGTSMSNGGHEESINLKNEHPDAELLRALEVQYQPGTSNEDRLKALHYLESFKTEERAPLIAYSLASNKSFPPIIRHYGMSLLEDLVRHQWHRFGDDHGATVQAWIVKLASSVSSDDPHYIRTKAGVLWVELAKRTWGLSWSNMDELLVGLWNESLIYKELVLEILENLSENAIGRDDYSWALRGTDLSKACVEIFTPSSVMAQHFPLRDAGHSLRYGDEGWLHRIAELLRWCSQESRSRSDVPACAVKALVVLRSVVSWTVLPGLAATQCVPRMCDCLAYPHQAVQLAAIEALYTLFFRPTFSEHDTRDLVLPMFTSGTVAVLHSLYEWSVVSADDVHDDRYLLCKKLAEMIHNVGRFLEEKPKILTEVDDLPGFLDLLLKIVRNDSLNVSIPILHLWSQLLNSPRVGSSPAVMALVGPLLELCSQRLIRYEALPEDSNLPSIVFLNQDLDTMPERHAFLGNYSRFCKDVVDSIVLKQPFEALNHIFAQTEYLLQHLYDGQPAFSPSSWTKYSIPALKLDAQCSLIEAALVGYGRWRGLQKATAAKENGGATAEAQNDGILVQLEKWCDVLLQLEFDDPSLQQRIVQLMTEFTTGPLRRQVHFVVQVFRYIIATKVRLASIGDDVQNPGYSNAMKELQRLCSHLLQKLALRTADPLLTVYDDAEQAISQYCRLPTVDPEDCDRAMAILFIILQRSTSIDEPQRQARLETFLTPAMDKWRQPELARLLETFGGFCELLGIAQLQDYFIKRHVHTVGDWATIPLDDEGLALKARIDAAQQHLPLRATRTLLSASVEKGEPQSQAHAVACTLWTKYLATILPSVLRFVSLAHSFSHPSHWSSLPPESIGIPARILKDRFWQVGISTGSRDEFYHRVEGSKSSLEGLASAVRGSLRLVRDTCYRLLCSMSFLDDALYSFEELPKPLATALFEGAGSLSTHQTGIILDMIRPIIDNCPVAARSHFLSPIIIALFTHLDRKVGMEWENIAHRNGAATSDDELLEEMKDESILRQLTFNCVSLVARLLDPKDRSPHARASSTESTPAPPPPPPDLLRAFVLDQPEVFKAVILFCTHALQMHDNRACGIITRVLRSIILAFGAATDVAADIREFISTEVLKACITSLHDPYFVDSQSELAQLIASIVHGYKDQTETPRQILLSLPDMTVDRVDAARYRLFKAEGNSRQQRAIVLRLLDGLRGVSLSEQGKLPRPLPEPKKLRTALEERYVTEPAKARDMKEPSPDMGGVAEMFE